MLENDFNLMSLIKTVRHLETVLRNSYLTDDVKF